MSMNIIPGDPNYYRTTEIITEHKELVEYLNSFDEYKISLGDFIDYLIKNNYTLVIEVAGNCSGIDVIDLNNELAQEWTW